MRLFSKGIKGEVYRLIVNPQNDFIGYIFKNAVVLIKQHKVVLRQQHNSFGYEL